MTYVVTGATGQLGRLVVENLLDRGVPAAEIVAGGRQLDRIADLAERGVEVRRIDYADADSVATALVGARRVLIVSGMDVGIRPAQHTGVARAAERAGAELVAYTSAPYATTTSMLLAADHARTEESIAKLDVPSVFLRNGWYHENYTVQIPIYLEHGAILGSAGDGRISGAARADFAVAAGAVLTTDGHAGAVYELGGDAPYTLADLATVVSAATGKQVTYRDVPADLLLAALTDGGVPPEVAAVLADVDRAVRDDGALYIDSGDLARLIGRPATPLADTVAASV